MVLHLIIPQCECYVWDVFNSISSNEQLRGAAWFSFVVQTRFIGLLLIYCMTMERILLDMMIDPCL